MSNVKRGRRNSGEGTFKKLESGKIRMRKQIGYLPNGTPRILSVTGTSETDCIRKMKKKEEQSVGIILADSNVCQKITLTDLCKLHLEEHLNEKGRLKPKAADRRECTIRNQIEPYMIGRLQASTVTSNDVRDHIENLINEGKLSVSSVTKALDVINAAFKWAVSRRYLNTNPCDPVMDSLKNRLTKLNNRNSSDGVVKVLGDNQIEELEKYVKELKFGGDEYKYMFSLSVLVLLYTGIRVGELCALRWRDWSEQSQTITISQTRFVSKHGENDKKDKTYTPKEDVVKNYHSRTIILDPKAVNALQEIKRITPRKNSDDYIVINTKDNPTNPSNYDSRIKSIYMEAGLPEDISGAHILRRTIATKMHNDGCRVEEIAAYLGDEPRTVEKHYISLTQKIVADGKVLNVVKYPTANNKNQ